MACAYGYENVVAELLRHQDVDVNIRNNVSDYLLPIINPRSACGLVVCGVMFCDESDIN